MQNNKLVSLLFVATAGCGVADSSQPGDDGLRPTEPEQSELRISPASFDARMFDDSAVTQQFKATLVDADGTEQDVTNQVTFELADTRFGKFHGNELEVMGGGAGKTDVIAKLGLRTGHAPLQVFISGERDVGAGAAAHDLFAHANATGGCAPSLLYPENDTLVPANLGELDVHWSATNNNLFAVRVRNLYVDLTYYTMNKQYMTVVNDWSKFATSKAPITIDVTAMNASVPGTKCITAARTVSVTDQDSRGGVYYWTTDWAARAAGQDGQGIMRYDLSKPQIAAEPLFSDANKPAACVGCHAVSRDGSRIALTMDGATGRGTVLDLKSGRELMPQGGDAPRWSTAVFTPDGSKLVAVTDGQMRLLGGTSGQVLATIPNTPGTIAGNPEMSPDGTKLVNVESTGTDDWAFPNASVVVRSFDSKTNTFGAATTVIPFDDATGMQSYYPSWSPDGKWLAITRSPNANSYANPDATIWVVKSDGTGPMIKLDTTEGVMDSWARWMPYASSVGGEPVYFLSFSSERSFGVRLPDGGLPQIWIAPFYPERAVAGETASGPAFRAPFQSITSSNHNAQWADSVVTAE